MRLELKGIKGKELAGDKILLLLKNNEGFAFKPKTIIKILGIDENAIRAALRRSCQRKEINKVISDKKISFYFF